MLVLGSERMGLFKTMSAGNESSMTSCSSRRRTSSIEHLPATPAWSLARLFRPWALVFVGLALSVSLWGFGYKLSRYNPHPDASSQALFAKLWDKHQDVSQLTAATDASARSFQSRLVVNTVLILLCQPPNPIHHAVFHDEDCERTPVSFQPVVPLRSPPSYV